MGEPSVFDSVPRFASLSPGAARWFLAILSERGVDSRLVRGEVEFRRRNGYEAQADEVDHAWRQLAASAEWAKRASRSQDPRSDIGPTDRTDLDSSARSDQDEIDTEEARVMLGFKSRSNVVRLINDHKLPGRQVGRSWLIPRASVESLAELRAS